MLRLDYDTQSLEEFYNLPQGSFYSEQCIVDLELKNDISPNWIYSEGRPCAVGFLYRNKITILVATAEDDPEFKDAVWVMLIENSNQTKLWAFNSGFEKGVLKALFGGFEFPFEEIKPVKGKGWSKDKCYEILRERKVIEGDKQITDIFNGDGKLCAQEWQNYLKSGDKNHLVRIVSHNLNCLMKQALIRNHRQWFIVHLEVNKYGFTE